MVIAERDGCEQSHDKLSVRSARAARAAETSARKFGDRRNVFHSFALAEHDGEVHAGFGDDDG